MEVKTVTELVAVPCLAFLSFLNAPWSPLCRAVPQFYFKQCFTAIHEDSL